MSKPKPWGDTDNAPSPSTDPVTGVGASAGLVAAVERVLARAAEAQALTSVSYTVEKCRDLVNSPPTVLISGRMKAGKSTLVNALVRQKIADTSILECTNALTVYAKGAPERIENVPLVPAESSYQRLTADNGNIPSLHGRVQVHYLPSEALSQMNYVDTPGLGTIDATNRKIVDSLRALTRVPWNKAGNSIDGIVYVFDSALRDDELSHLVSLGFPAIAAVGVVSRADDYGSGAFGDSNPIVKAREAAAKLSIKYAHVFNSVTAVSGLMAETAETGGVNEQLTRYTGSLGTIDRERLMHELETDARTSLSPQIREELLRALGPFGVLEGRFAAEQGAVRLRRFLRDSSGISQLSRQIDRTIGYATALNRAGKVYEDLHNLAFSQEFPDVLDYWDEELSSRQKLAVTLFSLLREAPGNRVSASTIQDAQTALALESNSYPDTSAIAEIEEKASEKLLRLVSPLEERILGAVLSLCKVIAV